MHLGEPANKKIKTVIRATAAAFILLFLFAFRYEIIGFFLLIWAIFKVLLGFPFDGDGRIFTHILNIILYNCLFGFGLVFLIWLFLISTQALLPVKDAREVYRTAWHMVLYILRRHGPAVHIKDGELIASKGELNRMGHGVFVVDFNSAVVLEKRSNPPGLSQLFGKTISNFLFAIALSDRPENIRVCGPGIVFSQPGERVRGTVDLRKQFRMQTQVHCYTREGIELYANVNAIFTIGQDPEPDALQVTYLGEHRPENLRVLTLTPVAGGGGRYLRVTGMSEELDEADAQEIHHFARVLEHTGDLHYYHPLPQHKKPPSSTTIAYSPLSLPRQEAEIRRKSPGRNCLHG
jgi:hypothetical protein